jgi:hypothetical protein
VRKKPSNVPVFLIYAGVIHAIGLALLLPTPAAKKDNKIAPFNGALSGLFSPAAPARRR